MGDACLDDSEPGDASVPPSRANGPDAVREAPRPSPPQTRRCSNVGNRPRGGASARGALRLVGDRHGGSSSSSASIRRCGRRCGRPDRGAGSFEEHACPRESSTAAREFATRPGCARACLRTGPWPRAPVSFLAARTPSVPVGHRRARSRARRRRRGLILVAARLLGGHVAGRSQRRPVSCERRANGRAIPKSRTLTPREHPRRRERGSAGSRRGARCRARAPHPAPGPRSANDREPLADRERPAVSRRVRRSTPSSHSIAR